MIELQSYLQGKWVRGAGTTATLVNPATEEPLATASTEGLDFRAALEFARSVGGPALRTLTFSARGEILQSVARTMHAHRDELIELSIANAGTTRSDAKFDIDGASATLAAYADLSRELGDTHILADGEGTLLGRSKRLFGQHVYLPREGVAVHINAFNFPAWGLAEKAATALLAGMPVISKPGTSTALLAHRIVQLILEDNLLPEGTLSFIAGSTGDLLDHLHGQDVLAFTGSGETGAMLRQGKGIVHEAARINVEADSLNAAVLGPDVDVGSELIHLFVKDMVREMTQKTGQKCTATRRIYIPQNKVEAILEHMTELLQEVQVGNPSLDHVTMGPLATAQQLKDVRSGIAKLQSCTRTVAGSAMEVAGPVETDKGFFVGPVLLHCNEPSADDPVHNFEVFGPVATVMPYDGTAAGAVRWVTAGGGGLVSSVYSDDRTFVTETVRGIAPFHGRVTISSTKVATQTVPPGTVLPQLVHGGPGRAGGGEELGGTRGLTFYMQRVALQGDRPLVEIISGKR